MKTVTFDPELWQLVPVKSNAVMRNAGWKNLSCMGSCGEASPPDPSDFGDVYDAMISAAPQPPAEPLKDLSDDEILQMAASVMIRVREAAYKRKPKFNYTVEIARMVILADRKLNEPAEPMKEKLMSAESRIKELEAGNNDLQSCENEYLKEIEELKTQLAQGGEPVAWLRNTTDPQPHAVTNLKYRSAADAKAGVQYVPVCVHPAPDAEVTRDATADLLRAILMELEDDRSCNSYHPTIFHAIEKAKAAIAKGGV